MTINLIQLLEETVQNYAERTALISDQQDINYRQLNQAVNAVAALLQESGIRKGDKVAIMLPNVPEFVYSYFGTIKIGGVAVPLNTSSTAYELTYLLNNSDAKVLLTFSSYVKKYEDAGGALTSCQKVIALDSLNQNGSLINHDSIDQSLFRSVDVHPEDIAAIIYTAGLTGRPLGAMLTHRNLCSQADMIQSIVNRTPDDVALCLIPLFHTFGATVNMLLVIRAAASMVMMEKLTMDSLLNTIEKQKITYIAAVPRLYIGMIFYEKTMKYDLSSVKVCVSGGAPIPAEFLTVFEEKFGKKIYEGYGLTEASPVCSFNRLDTNPRPGSIGTAIPGIEIKIVDDEGMEIPRNEIGEVIVRGENVMKGYYKEEAATDAVIKKEWLYTGDLGRMDETGYIYLTGLKKRMIITSGFNVYPREVETVLNMHPAVHTSLVRGKEDLMRGEIVKANIVLKDGYYPDEKEIVRFCKTYLSNYKVPREVEFVKEIPLSEDIKI
ncbi:MAG: long-chain fatty acid--CoA ligase [Smithella sp.]|nr:long-chain fatty acid--CoA ligase [Smithella sp.]